MRIGIDVDVATEKELRGVGYHIVSLVRGLGKIDHQNEYVLYYQRGLRKNTGRLYPFPHQSNFRARPVRFPEGWKGNHPKLWWRHYLPWIVRLDRIDVFHGPSHFLPALGSCKTVVTIHDIAFMKMDLYSKEFTNLMRVLVTNSLQSATRVVAISKNTRIDLEAFGVDPQKMRLIYGGGNIVPEDQIDYDRAGELRKAYNLPERYIVYVGTLGLRKNLVFLLRSYAELKRAHRLPHALVLVGKRLAGVEEMDQLIRDLGIERDVIITGYVDAWQVPLFYKMADLFVLPTLYEGFTLVTLEAMAYGVPLIATDTSSIREGVGDAGLLVEVNNVSALTAAMHKVLTDEDLRRTLIERGKQQAQKFTWEQCARETLSLYKELHGSHNGS
jgi:glycosyltransferase involved in cell wall biosynthesis